MEKGYDASRGEDNETLLLFSRRLRSRAREINLLRGETRPVTEYRLFAGAITFKSDGKPHDTIDDNLL